MLLPKLDPPNALNGFCLDVALALVPKLDPLNAANGDCFVDAVVLLPNGDEMEEADDANAPKPPGDPKLDPDPNGVELGLVDAANAPNPPDEDDPPVVVAENGLGADIDIGG